MIFKNVMEEVLKICNKIIENKFSPIRKIGVGGEIYNCFEIMYDEIFFDVRINEKFINKDKKIEFKDIKITNNGLKFKVKENNEISEALVEFSTFGEFKKEFEKNIKMKSDIQIIIGEKVFEVYFDISSSNVFLFVFGNYNSLDRFLKNVKKYYNILYGDTFLKKFSCMII